MYAINILHYCFQEIIARHTYILWWQCLRHWAPCNYFTCGTWNLTRAVLSEPINVPLICNHAVRLQQ